MTFYVYLESSQILAFVGLALATVGMVCGTVFAVKTLPYNRMEEDDGSETTSPAP